jgi:hypothetical protein
MLSVSRMYSAELEDEWRIFKDLEGSGSGLRDNIPEFAWRESEDWNQSGLIRKTIRTQHLSNTSDERYRYDSLLGGNVTFVMNWAEQLKQKMKDIFVYKVGASWSHVTYWTIC